MYEFEDLETSLLFEQLSLENEEIIEESNISVEKINAPKKKNRKSRNILITNSGNSSHQGRMKVSKPGENINRKTSHNDYISIFRKDQNTISYDGNLKNIDMDSSEYEYYKNLFIRNENIIQLVKTGNGQYDQYVDDALIRDEQRRVAGNTVIRDVDGDAKIYDKNNELIRKENIKGEKI